MDFDYFVKCFSLLVLIGILSAYYNVFKFRLQKKKEVSVEYRLIEFSYNHKKISHFLTSNSKYLSDEQIDVLVERVKELVQDFEVDEF